MDRLEKSGFVEKVGPVLADFPTSDLIYFLNRSILKYKGKSDVRA